VVHVVDRRAGEGDTVRISTTKAKARKKNIPGGGVRGIVFFKALFPDQEELSQHQLKLYRSKR